MPFQAPPGKPKDDANYESDQGSTMDDNADTMSTMESNGSLYQDCSVSPRRDTSFRSLASFSSLSLPLLRHENRTGPTLPDGYVNDAGMNYESVNSGLNVDTAYQNSSVDINSMMDPEDGEWELDNVANLTLHRGGVAALNYSVLPGRNTPTLYRPSPFDDGRFYPTLSENASDSSQYMDCGTPKYMTNYESDDSGNPHGSTQPFDDDAEQVNQGLPDHAYGTPRQSRPTNTIEGSQNTSGDQLGRSSLFSCNESLVFVSPDSNRFMQLDSNDGGNVHHELNVVLGCTTNSVYVTPTRKNTDERQQQRHTDCCSIGKSSFDKSFDISTCNISTGRGILQIPEDAKNYLNKQLAKIPKTNSNLRSRTYYSKGSKGTTGKVKRRIYCLNDLQDTTGYTSDEVNDNDVLTGRGGDRNKHPGNVKLHNLVDEKRPELVNADIQRKAQSAEAIVSKMIRDFGTRYMHQDIDTTLGTAPHLYYHLKDKIFVERVKVIQREPYTREIGKAKRKIYPKSKVA
jgi:hypothetical protein